jgi:Holliday junction resolvase
MPSNVHKGRALEYSVRDRLRSLGYVVFRCAGSRPVDLIAVKHGELLLVECKAGLHPFLSTRQFRSLMEVARDAEATLLLAVRKRHRGIEWFEVTEKGLNETSLLNTSISQDA